MMMAWPNEATTTFHFTAIKAEGRLRPSVRQAVCDRDPLHSQTTTCVGLCGSSRWLSSTATSTKYLRLIYHFLPW